MTLTRNQATALGMLSPVFWGMSVGLIRGLSQLMGPFLGVAIVFTTCFIGFFLTFPRPKLSDYRPLYLVCGVGSSILCEICFALSLFLSQSERQTVEIGMVNYLWPALIIVFAILFNGQRAKVWIIPGFILAIAGIVKILSGDAGFDLADTLQRIGTNPVSYLLGLGSAIGWAAYCSFSKALADGKNPIVIIYAGNALTFWILSFCFQDVAGVIHLKGVLYALGCALIFGSSFACWTTAVAKGSITLLALASYFTPVLSCVFASFWLGATLTHTFWIGVAMVVAGSIICWAATRGTERV